MSILTFLFLLTLTGALAELPPRYRDRVVRLIEAGDPLVTQALEARGPGWTIARGNTCRDRGDCGREAHTFTTFIEYQDFHLYEILVTITPCGVVSYSIFLPACVSSCLKYGLLS